MVSRSKCSLWTVFAQARWKLRSGEDNVTQAKMALEQVCYLEYFCSRERVFARMRGIFAWAKLFSLRQKINFFSTFSFDCLILL